MIELKQALQNSLRKHITDPADRGTLQTDSFVGDGATTDFTLTKKPLCYINSITIDGVTQRIIRDFSINFGTTDTEGIITFTTAPADSSDIEINYKYGTNWIYYGYPQETAQMPRIGIIRTGGGNEPAGAGDTQHFEKPFFKIAIWIKSGVAYTINGVQYTGDKLLDFLEQEITNSIVDIRRDCEIHNNITMSFGDISDAGMSPKYNILKRNGRLSVWQQRNY